MTSIKLNSDFFILGFASSVGLFSRLLTNFELINISRCLERNNFINYKKFCKKRPCSATNLPIALRRKRLNYFRELFSLCNYCFIWICVSFIKKIVKSIFWLLFFNEICVSNFCIANKFSINGIYLLFY